MYIWKVGLHFPFGVANLAERKFTKLKWQFDYWPLKPKKQKSNDLWLALIIWHEKCLAESYKLLKLHVQLIIL
jgi:hypothetical protein